MNLHSDILNIRADEAAIYYKFGTDGGYAYKLGHKDARHAAAEISLKGDKAIELLKEALHCCEDEQLKSEIKEFLEYIE